MRNLFFIFLEAKEEFRLPGEYDMKWLANPFYYIIFFAVASSLVALALLSGFVSVPAVFEVRGPITHKFARMGSEDLPRPIEEREKDGRQWAVRRPVDNKNMFLQVLVAKEMIDDALWLALDQPLPQNAANALQNGYKQFHSADIGRSRVLAPLLALDGTSVPQLFGVLPGENVEGLDARGQPLRFSVAEPLLAGYMAYPLRKRARNEENSPNELIPATPDYALSPTREQYRHLVERFARRYNLSVELVYAIIHSESDFSPTLVSSKSAMGLMQILPGTASGEVHSFLYGKRGSVSFAQLRVPEINIHYGTAYLHILFNRYFQNVSNPVSREYCAIAAYNMGPNRFLRLYGASNADAIEKINQFSPDELYNDLIRRLPARETRYYLSRVKKMKNYYMALLGKEESDSIP